VDWGLAGGRNKSSAKISLPRWQDTRDLETPLTLTAFSYLESRGGGEGLLDETETLAAGETHVSNNNILLYVLNITIVPYSSTNLILPLPSAGEGNPISCTRSVSLLSVSYNFNPFNPMISPFASLSNVAKVLKTFASVIYSSAFARGCPIQCLVPFENAIRYLGFACGIWGGLVGRPFGGGEESQRSGINDQGSGYTVGE
jgi:hypothetical protein